MNRGPRMTLNMPLLGRLENLALGDHDILRTNELPKGISVTKERHGKSPAGFVYVLNVSLNGMKKANIKKRFMRIPVGNADSWRENWNSAIREALQARHDNLQQAWHEMISDMDQSDPEHPARGIRLVRRKHRIHDRRLYRVSSMSRRSLRKHYDIKLGQLRSPTKYRAYESAKQLRLNMVAGYFRDVLDDVYNYAEVFGDDED